MHPLFTAKKAGQLYGMFMFYYVITICNVGYVCSFVGIKFLWVSLVSYP